MENNKKVTVIAIAKNEAPYLPEWVHHHFYYGFDKIVIGINRTDDNSEAIIAKLKTKYFDKLEVVNIDFIDKSCEGFHPRLQQIAYAYLTHREVASGCHNEMLLIDVDEFWVSRCGKLTICEYLSQLPYYDFLSFHWLFEPPLAQEFAAPFSGRTAYINRSSKTFYVKSQFHPKLYDHISIFGPHRPKVEEGFIRLDANGDKFEPYKKGFTSNPPNLAELKAFIFHRIKRSEVEYLAGQNKPDLISPDKAVRPSSNYYRNSFHIDNETIESLNISLPQAYYDSYEKMIDKCELSLDMSEARQLVVRNGHDFLNKDLAVIKEHLTDFLYKTHGTFMFFDLLKILENSLNEDSVKNQIINFCHNNKLSRKYLTEFLTLHRENETYRNVVEKLFKK